MRVSRYPESREAILDAIDAHTELAGPSLREVCAVVGLPVGTLHDYLCRLAEEGLVEWTPRRFRSLRLTEAGQRARRMPSSSAASVS